MKHVRNYKKWGIYEVTPKEIIEYPCSERFALIHPETMEALRGTGIRLTPYDADWFTEQLHMCTEWIDNY